MNVAHILLREATIRAVDYNAGSNPEVGCYVAMRFDKGVDIFVTDREVAGSHPERATVFATPGMARALATLILKALPPEPDTEGCPECGGTGVVERSIANGHSHSQDAELVCECMNAGALR